MSSALPLTEPLIVVALSGWVDAGGAPHASGTCAWSSPAPGGRADTRRTRSSGYRWDTAPTTASPRPLGDDYIFFRDVVEVHDLDSVAQFDS